MIIYLSGPMSGYPEHNYPVFYQAAALLRSKGYQVISPAEIGNQDASSWSQCMRNCIKVLMDADTVALLPGWENSKGANIEIFLASRLGMNIMDAITMQSLGMPDSERKGDAAPYMRQHD